MSRIGYILDELRDELETILGEKHEDEYQRGLKEGLQTRISQLNLGAGDILVIEAKNERVSSETLNGLSHLIRDKKFKAVLVEEHVKLSKLGEQSLTALGLKRIK